MGRFREALLAPGLSAIAEVKRRSPSAGDLRPGADPAALAREFEANGAAAVSILVDERFGGSIDDLRTARSATSLPLIAKGFFREPQELGALEAARADALLLILRDLDDRAVERLRYEAASLGLDVLIEAHDEAELGRALALGAELVGLNARDLGTFEVDRRAQLDLLWRFRTGPGAMLRDVAIVAESGIENRAHAAAAELAGADALLVGSTLMRAPEPGAKLAELLRRPLVKVCGLTRAEDVEAAAEAGADLAGFVLAESPRRAEAPLPVPDSMLSVGVFVGETEDLGTDLAQLYARENGHRARDGVLLRDGAEVARVVDLPWLQGNESPTPPPPDPLDRNDHWGRAAELEGRVVLAGGLGPENVREAIEAVRPWCVDASRSLETEPGIKDHDRVRAFVEAAR